MNIKLLKIFCVSVFTFWNKNIVGEEKSFTVFLEWSAAGWVEMDLLLVDAAKYVNASRSVVQKF